MLDDLFTRALIAGLGVALATGPLGCFVIWRRLAYFGDATAHAAILGVALALALEVSVIFGVLATALGMAFFVAGMAGRSLGPDALLGVAAHSALAIGLVAVALAAGPAVDVESYLFGDILAVGPMDLAVIWAGAAVVLGLLFWRWSGLLAATLSPELAWAEGGDPRREKLVLTLALALVVAAAIKVVGALLITAMLIIPAAAARPLARGPEGMAALATLIGAAAVWIGLKGAWAADAPAGPAIVAAAAGIFALTAILSGFMRAIRRAD